MYQIVTQKSTGAVVSSFPEAEVLAAKSHVRFCIWIPNRMLNYQNNDILRETVNPQCESR